MSKIKLEDICILKWPSNIVIVKIIKEHEDENGFYYKVLKITDMKNIYAIRTEDFGEDDEELHWDICDDFKLLTDEEKVKLL